ncbi:MAG: PAS domain-containing protein [Candidatus Latescibacterota bacterium]
MDGEHDRLDSSDVAAIEAAVAAVNSAAVLALFESQRRNYENALRKREAEFRALAEHSPDGIIRFNLDFQITHANPAAARMMGSSQEELLGKTPYEFTMPMHIVFLWQGGVERVFADGKEITFEYEFDDIRSVHYLQISMIPEIGPEDVVETVLAITRDNSEQKKTVVALRESDERFKLAIATSPRILFSQNSDLRYIWEFSSHPKLPADTFLGRTDYDIYPAEQAERMVALKRRVMETGEQAQEEYEVTISGEKVWLYVTIAPLRNNEGQVVGVTGVSMDITERKRSEEALRESEVLYRAIAQNFPDGAIYVFDHDLRFRVADGKAMSRLGFSREQLEGKVIWEATDEETYRILEERYPKVLAGETMHFETSIKGKIFSSDYVPIRDERGNITAGMVVSHDITDRKLAEEALRAAEETARQRLMEIEDLYHNAPVGLCVLDRDLRFVRINERLAEINGIPATDHIGKTVRELLPSLADAVEPGMRRILETGEIRLNFEIISETPAHPGLQRSWLEHWLPNKDSEGRVTGLSIVVEEITERKQAEEALQKAYENIQLQTEELQTSNEELRAQSEELHTVNEALRDREERLRLIVENSPDVIFFQDRDLRYTWVANPNVPTAGKRVIGKTDADIPGFMDADRIMDAKRRVIETGEFTRCEIHVTIDGEEHWFDDFYSPRYDSRGNIIGIFGYARDITERKRAEMALQSAYEELQTQSEELDAANEELRSQAEELQSQTEQLRQTTDFLENLFNYANAPIMCWDSKFCVTRFNHSFEHVTQYRANEVLGKNLSLLFPDESKEESLAEIQRTLSGEQWEIVEIPIRRKDGEIRIALWNSANVYAADGETLLATIAQGQDITERKQAEERIDQLRREQEAFMRHEVKNLFAPMQLFSEMLLSETENLTEQQILYLRRISESADRVTGFIDALKRIHEIEAGRYVLKRVRHPLDMIIWQAIHDLEPVAERNRVTIRFHAPEKDAVLLLDRHLMPGVFTNLILNAIEHVEKLKNPEQKLVTVDFLLEKGRYIVRINNKGEPVPPERLATFFEKYNPGTEKKQGTGLGTTYAYLVTKAHGGEVTVSSNAEEGTTVTVELPIKLMIPNES